VEHLDVGDLLSSFRAGQSCRTALEASLACIADESGEGKRAFTRVYAASAREQADAADALYRCGSDAAGPLAGVTVSVKDLFDVAGDITTAGSRVLANAAPATADAEIVSRLKRAGAVIVGRTNMTEFAYSGVGLNPHYGTPKNPYDRASALIPGGSSAGAVVSVSDGMAAVAIGTDTGGSLRIPAALCGLVGFKPTARRVPMDGVLPLAPSLDSVGPIGRTVDCCARVDAVLAGEEYEPLPHVELSSLRLGVLQGYVLDAMDDATVDAFDRTLTALSAAGARVVPVEFAALARIPASNQTAATEAYAWHRTLLEASGHLYDPHVSARILHGAGVLAADYLDLMRARREIIREAERAFDGFDAILLPTTPRVAPPIASLEQSDDVYFDVNGAMLRNTSIFNFLDGCGLSIPCQRVGDAPVGLMIAGLGGWDARILRVGAAIEALLRNV
jgi:aspartyl-tRNA(Asn)/glutamyl-tRNA(Gln) amidotransferase subunit A